MNPGIWAPWPPCSKRPVPSPRFPRELRHPGLALTSSSQDVLQLLSLVPSLMPALGWGVNGG